jgi:hypothetical protein
MMMFWRKWLMVVSGLVVVMGVVFAILALTPIFPLLAGLLDPIFWPDAAADPGTVRFQRFAFGVSGGVTAGWGVLIYALARWAFAGAERWVWNALMASSLTWFVLDSAVSAASGAIFNVAFNAVFVALFLLPLIRTRGLFRLGGAQVQSRMTLPERPERMASKPSA